MENFIDNIEKTRNTEEQISFYSQLSEFIDSVECDGIKKINTFPVYATRQNITSFLERYELYKLCKNTPGSIVECGVAGGFGLMSFSHFASIFEPYHYTRKIIGFDTFDGFVGITKQDSTSKAEHLKVGGLKFDSYDLLQKAISLYDQNRALGHLNKVELVKGDISKTFPEYLEANPSLVIAMLYMDLDLYKPTLDTLKLIKDRIPKGGIIVFDELNHPDYPGETIAAMEALGIHNLKLRRFDFSSMMSYAIVE